MADGIPVFHGGKVVGFLFDDGKYWTPRKRSRHFFWKLNAWGVSADVMTWLRNHGCKTIIIHERESGDTLASDIEDWDEYGKTRNLGFGNQMFLCESHFEISKAPVAQMEFPK